jgi:hypothetical protein
MTRFGLACLAALVPATVLAAPAGAKPIRTTHTVTIEGRLVNHWTIDEPGPCGLVGDGTVTVEFRTTVRTRVLPYIDPYIRGETGRYGTWVVTVPIGANRDRLTGLGYVPATGTITRVDNTTTHPPTPGDECEPVKKDACGTFPLERRAKAGIGRFDGRRITVNLAPQDFQPRRGSCGAGQLEFWSDHRYAGRTAEGWLPVDMPRAAALKRRRVVKASGRSHKRTVFADPGDETVSDDVTRSATVTFRRR